MIRLSGWNVTASVLVFLSALIIATLGLIHLIYTFHGPKLAPRNAALRAAMEADSPGISIETTMWRAWIGFNASHSLGALLFGLMYGYLAVSQPGLLFGSDYLSTVGFGMLAALLFLGKRYGSVFLFGGLLLHSYCTRPVNSSRVSSSNS